ncbi:MAG: PAS domain S-box protein [Methanoregula sp.]
MISVHYVDDEKDLLEIAQLFLEKSGEFRVVTSTSAQDALNSPSLLSCDAIVSDYQMPGMDGIAFLKEVRERFGDIPFILFTGRGREEVVIDAINNGADFYIQKGGDPAAQFAELAHKIRQAVRRKRAERLLHDSERRLADIIDFLPDATFAIDRSGHVITWNRAIEEMTGIPAGDMLGKGDYEYTIRFYGSRRPGLIDLIDEPDEKILQFYSNVRRTGNSLTVETELPHPKGHRIFALLKAGPLYNPEGEITGAIESIRDITELKKIELELRAAYEQVTATEEELRSHYDELQTANEHLTAAKQELLRHFDQLAESERTIRINEERLAMAQAVGHSGSWEYDLATDKIWGSANALCIFGYPAVAGDFPIADIEACIPERERIHQALIDLITTEQEYNLDYIINPADGSSPRDIHSIARLEKEMNGQPAKVIGVIEDITERKRAGEVLRESEEKYRDLFNHANDQIISHEITPANRPGRILDANDRVIEALGYTKAELLTLSMPDITMPQSEKEMEWIGTSLRTASHVTFEGEERTKDGRIIPVEVSLQYYNGNSLCVAIIREITERRKAEQALMESEEKYRNLVETSPGMIWEIDVRGKFQYISPSSESIMGYTPDELVGKTILDLTPHERTAFALQELSRLVSSQGPYLPFEVAARHRDGHDLVIEVRASPVIGPDGKIRGFRGVIIDITERKKAEEKLRLANRQLNLLGSITRHDILNKITVILGYLKIAELNWNDPALGEYLRKIKSATTAIRSHIEFTRLYQRLGTHEPQWIDVDTILPCSQVPATIVLKMDVQGVSVFTDPMLENVLCNLLDNSVRHGERVTEIRVSSHKEGEVLVLVWEDNGTGIAADEKKRIFERGFGKNTGLGLFLIQEILALTGIAIRETGEPGKGARFEILVPKGKYRIT